MPHQNADTELEVEAYSIAIIGKGNFGSALARLFNKYVPQYEVLQLDKSPDSEAILGIEEVQRCDAIIPAVPLSKFEVVIEQIKPLIKPGTMVIDVCTTSCYPAEIMQKHFPQHVHLLSTHPLFGPESLETAGWDLTGLNLVIWPLRMPEAVYNTISKDLEKTGINVIHKSPEEHDRTLAESQFLSLLVGALLEKLDIQSTAMNTRSFDELLDVKATTRNDYHILLDVFRYNPYCAPKLNEVLETIGTLGNQLQAYIKQP